MRDHIAKLVALAHHAHQDRDFESHKDADHHHQGIHEQLKALRVGESQKQQRGREAPDHAEH